MRRSVPMLLAAMLAPAALDGCYAYTAYVHDRPAPGTVVEVTLNDRGRVLLADNVGPEVWRVEGAVASVADSSFVLNVRRVTGLDRASSRWAGEAVMVPLAGVRDLRERQFSSGRTVLLAGSVAAGIAGIIATTGIYGSAFGNGGTDPGPPNPNGQ